MDLLITGDVAIVVGGARGLGRAIAEAFAAEGAGVAIVDRAEETVEVARAIGEASRVRAEGFVADVTDGRAMRQVAEAIVAGLGRCDHLVFAAGIGSGKFGFPFWNLEPSDWERVLRVNLVGAVNAAHAFAPAMAEAKRGTLLFVASVAGQIGSQTDPPYSASKAGLINFAQCAARDLAPFGVRVNTLCPGMVKTALNRSVFESWAARQPESGRPSYEEWAADKIAKLVPLGRWQEPEDIAAMAVFLASPRAGNVTGQTINVDGGYVMHW
ncbi:MAG TPA: SDR family oxidoreductase [Isosphaeraceae bacterium]|jgi:NAD(P)-dependent dehydrogenase (short-subunit alcohol dehydrogenase family)|nr:SDR family oxidoreductase [Isosphaeraceae bacterium]